MIRFWGETILRYPTAEMTKRRVPFSDPRQGRLLETIHNAFIAHATDTLPSPVLVDWCYGGQAIRKLVGSPSWHRATVKRAALKICIPVGRATGKGAGSGCPMLWRIDPERMESRSWRGKLNRKRARQGLTPIDD
jgi:hypothetical protein